MITSCVILNYNDSETTVSLINHIKDSKELDYIVVIDNLSTDNSYEILKKFKSSKIHVLLSDRNGGYGYGNNLGIKYSFDKLNTDYILIANPDVIFSDNCVRELRQALVIDSQCAISAAVPFKPDGQRQKVVAWKLPTIIEEILSTSLIIGKLTRTAIRYDDQYFHNKERCHVDVVQGSLLMVNATIMIKYGMYDEDFFLYYEEQVLAKKIKKNNYKSLLLLDQNYIHNHSVSISKSYNSAVRKKRLLLESKLLYLKKYESLKGIRYQFARLFFFLSLGETWVISIINKIRKKG
jgi:N-acetylglucosaminyl-diphospho-decaprenol L-rhamnosyltransferase